MGLKDFKTRQRKRQIEQGYFDGRFNERKEVPKNKYKRHYKHKKIDYEKGE